MPFNGPIDGDYSNCDWKEAPWVDKIMVFNHDECLFILGRIQEVIEAYNPDDNEGSPISDSIIHSDYNNSDWEYAISWSTFLTLRQYNPEYNTQGINEDGIIPEPEVEEPEEPTEEEETIFPEETTPEEDTTEVVQENEAPTEEETTTEIPAE
jgi:hypothetical protein